MHYLESDIIFTANSQPIRNGVLVLNKEGEVLDVLRSKKGLEKKNIRYIQGALCPGFVNTHCHLELSHLEGKLTKKTGLPRFIAQIPKIRIQNQSIIFDQIEKLDKLMHENGIVAVADISNTNNTFKIKSTSPIIYHTFIELFSLNPDKAEEVFILGKKLFDDCTTSCSITPHANYSVSKPLFNLISEHNQGRLISIHNQETLSEDEMFKQGSGILFDSLKNTSFFQVTNKTALQSIFPILPKSTLLMVHNTYTSKEDMQWLNQQNDQVYWCTCPKANIYIENKLPNYNDWIDSNSKITIGTDSLASNDTLDILQEMIVIYQNTNIDLQTLIVWACKNGADFLGLNNLGTFEKGKVPGVNIIKNLDDNFQLTKDSYVRPFLFD